MGQGTLPGTSLSSSGELRTPPPRIYGRYSPVPHADKHGEAYTLCRLTAGNQARLDVTEALETTPKMFRSGEADLELVQTYASGDMAVLVAIERQHGEVGGMPDQDWSLRVTLVFQYEGTEWQLVHRHADPLVHTISMEHMAILARGHS